MCSNGRVPEVLGSAAEGSTAAYVSEDRIDEVAVPEVEESSLQVGNKTESGKKPETPVSGKEFNGNGVA